MIDINELSQEYIKCLSDKSRVYMIENYLKTYDATQRREVPYKLFPKQKDLCFTLGNANNIVCTKPRQAGITSTSGAFISCEVVLAEKETPQTVLVIGNTLDLAQQMLFKIRDYLLQFPLWMWGEEFFDLGYDVMEPPTNKNIIFNTCNGKELKLKNGCKVVARSSGPDASRGVGGVTWLIFDESAFIENGTDVYASAIPTVSTGGHVIMISTPNGMEKLYYETARRAKLKGTPDWNNFELVDMRWYQDPRYNKFLEWTKKNEESGEIEIIKETLIDADGNVNYEPEKWAKLEDEGWKARSPWYIKMCQQFNNDAQKIAQELDVSFLGSDSTVVAPEYIQMQRDLNNKEPLEELKDPLYEDLWIWKPPYEGHKYILAIDNSCGSSDDSTAFEIIDTTGINDDGTPCVEQVLEYNGKITGDIIGELAYKYGLIYNTAFIVVECIGGYGDSTILTLMNLKYPNLYYDDPTLKKYVDQKEASSLQATKDGLPGFRSSSLRTQMLSNFANLVKTNQFKIRSKRVCNELSTWVFKSNGRIDHKDGCHDDTLTCLSMGLFVMEYSMKRQEQCKALDNAMLKAMISANSPSSLQYMSKNNQEKNKKFNSGIYTSSQTFGGDNESSKYKANMWLLT